MLKDFKSEQWGGLILFMLKSFRFGRAKGKSKNWEGPNMNCEKANSLLKSVWRINTQSIVTRRFFYMKTVKIKVIQNFMEITFYIKTYSKRTCWKKFFKFKFWLFFVDIWRRIRLQAMATRQQPPTNQNKNIVSKIETENKMLNNIFQQVFSEKQLKQRATSIKFWITFIINIFL